MKRSRKRMGTEAEVELCYVFIKSGYRSVRIAGSGNMENADCDIISANKNKTYCIEAKSSRKGGIYIKKDQIRNLLKFAEDTNFIPVVALRFIREKWIFIHPNQLENTGTTLSITLKRAKKEGKKFEEFF